MDIYRRIILSGRIITITLIALPISPISSSSQDVHAPVEGIPDFIESRVAPPVVRRACRIAEHLPIRTHQIVHDFPIG
jgi:hypothetical protein